MPRSYHDVILDLKRAHGQMGWFQKLFFPSQLVFELARYPEQAPTNQNQLAVFKAFEKNTWFFQKWFFRWPQLFDENNHTKAFRTLSIRGLLTGDVAQADFNAVVAHQDPDSVALALDTLNRAGLLTGDAAQANCDALVAQQYPNGVALVLRSLNTAGLLAGGAAQTNFNAVIAHQHPYDVDRALDCLITAGLLTGDAAQANFNAVIAHQSPDEVERALNCLNTAGLLTGDAAQTNFNAVVITHTAILLHPNNNQNDVNFWVDGIPYGRPTATEFQAMIDIAQAHANNPEAGSRALRAYLNENILDINRQENAAQPEFNPNQSTHTASVHASVSQSATHLLHRYRDKIEGCALDTPIRAFASWL